MAEAGELVVKIGADTGDYDKAMAKAPKTADTAMTSIVKSITGAAASWKVFDTIAKGIEFNKAAEQAKVAFTVMTGSAQEAEATLKSLKDFANKTPLEFADIRDATQTLLAFGLSSVEATGAIKMLGDVSGGNAQKLQSLATVFGQISANGKLTGGDLLQLVNVGFNPLQEIADKTGKSMAELRKEMEEGQISFEMVEDAFKSATSEGGRFFGMLDKQSTTLTGKISTMNDAVDTALGSMTEAFGGPMKIGAEIMTSLANAFGELPPGIQAATGTIVALGGALLAAIPAAKTFGITLSSSFGPIGLAAAAATAAIVALIAQLEQGAKNTAAVVKSFANPIAEVFGKSGEEAEKLNMRLAEIVINLSNGRLSADMLKAPGFFEQMADRAGVSTAVLAEAIARSNQFGGSIKDLVQKYRNQSAIEQEIKSNQEAIASRYKTTTVEIKTKTELTEKEQKAQKDLQKSTIERLSAEYDMERDNYEEREKDGEASLASAIARGKDLTDQRKKELDTVTTLVEEAEKEITKTEQEGYQKRLAMWDKLGAHMEIQMGKINEGFGEFGAGFTDLLQSLIDGTAVTVESVVQTVGGLATGLIEALGDNQQAYFDKQMRMVDESTKQQLAAYVLLEKTAVQKAQAELDAAIKAGDKEKIAEKEKELQKAKITEDAERKKAKIKYDADKAQWDNNMAMALVNAAQAIIMGFAQLGPIGGAIAAVATGIATGLQIDTMSKNKPTPPAFAKGTDFAPGGMALVGEQGPELVNLPRGSQVFTASETRDMMRGGRGGMSVTVNNYSPEAIDPSQSANMTRRAMQQLSFQGAFA